MEEVVALRSRVPWREMLPAGNVMEQIEGLGKVIADLLEWSPLV